jgi:hypothetical protein
MSKIEPPLVEGEWVVAEHVFEIRGGTVTVRAEGPVWFDSDRDANVCEEWLSDGQETRGGWTILERRPPKPDWADADAILVEWKNGNSVAYANPWDGRFGNTTTNQWLEHLRDGDVISIRGLYLRDKS